MISRPRRPLDLRGRTLATICPLMCWSSLCKARLAAGRGSKRAWRPRLQHLAPCRAIALVLVVCGACGAGGAQGGTSQLQAPDAAAEMQRLRGERADRERCCRGARLPRADPARGALCSAGKHVGVARAEGRRDGAHAPGGAHCTRQCWPCGGGGSGRQRCQHSGGGRGRRRNVQCCRGGAPARAVRGAFACLCVNCL